MSYHVTGEKAIVAHTAQRVCFRPALSSDSSIPRPSSSVKQKNRHSLQPPEADESSVHRQCLAQITRKIRVDAAGDAHVVGDQLRRDGE
jgi:hypothetical protein